MNPDKQFWTALRHHPVVLGPTKRISARPHVFAFRALGTSRATALSRAGQTSTHSTFGANVNDLLPVLSVLAEVMASRGHSDASQFFFEALWERPAPYF